MRTASVEAKQFGGGKQDVAAFPPNVQPTTRRTRRRFACHHRPGVRHCPAQPYRYGRTVPGGACSAQAGAWLPFSCRHTGQLWSWQYRDGPAVEWRRGGSGRSLPLPV